MGAGPGQAGGAGHGGAPGAALPVELATRRIVDYSEPGLDAAYALAAALIALPPAPAPPEVLPEAPAAPLSYLADLVEQPTQSESLTHEQQRQIVTQLESGLRSADPDERQGAQYVLDRLSSRDDLYADVDRRLGELGAAGQNTDKPTAPGPTSWKRKT